MATTEGAAYVIGLVVWTVVEEIDQTFADIGDCVKPIIRCEISKTRLSDTFSESVKGMWDSMEGYARSPREVCNHIRIVIHSDSSSAIVTIIRADCCKLILRTVGEIFVLDTYTHSSITMLQITISTQVRKKTHSHQCHHCQ